MDDAKNLKDLISKKEKSKDYTLKQILFNEGLSRPRKQTVVNKWKKAITLIIDLNSRKDFEMMFIEIKLKSIKITVTDDIAKKEQPLLILTLSGLDIKMDSSALAKSNPAKTERLFLSE